MGIGYILSVEYVFFADIKHLYDILLGLWMYLSAIFYPAEALPEYAQNVIFYNPMFLAIKISRSVLLYGQLPAMSEWIKLIFFTAVSFLAGIWIFTEYEGKVMRKI